MSFLLRRARCPQLGTRSLLAFARRQTLDPKLVDTGTHLKTIAGLLQRTLGEDITVRLDLAWDLWPVLVDVSQLDSCILNLATNARDAMPHGGSLLIAASNVSLSEISDQELQDSASGDHVVIEVSDTGIGMPPDVLAKVFEPFFTTKALGQGTGLGLSMVYGFVRQSGGQIRIYSEVGRGTVVRIYLPRARGVAQEVEISISEPQNPRGNERILLVEDNPQIRHTALTQLRSLGYQVEVAENGSEALDLLAAIDWKVDLVFTDMVMPGRPDGLELSRLVRERAPQIRFLLTSGFPGDVWERHGSTQPTLPLLSKPYRKADLARAIRSTLDASKPE